MIAPSLQNLKKYLEEFVGDKRNQKIADASLSSTKLWGKSYEERYKRWDKEGRPTRPNPQEVEIYKKFIGQLSPEKKILILGPTSELRDLVAGYSVTVADLSLSCIKEASKYLTRADPKDEVHISSNWLELPFPPGYFDIILGDMVLNQFPPGEEKKFLEKMRELCAPSGSFVSRFVFLDESFVPENLGGKVRRISERTRLTLREKVFSIANAAICCSRDPSLRLNNLYLAWTLLQNLLTAGGFNRHTKRMIRSAIAYLKENGMPGGRWWSYPSEEELFQIINLHFSVVGRDYAAETPAGRLTPIIRCIPKTK